MTVPKSLLALLAGRPAHGYALKNEFESHTARTWPLNIGQVYTTLGRLQRDGLVEEAEGSDEERRLWRITDSGRTALKDWYAEAVPIDPPPRDELAIKVLLAIATEAVDVSKILQRQRTATLERMQEFTRLKQRADPEDLPWLLMLDAMILRADSELRWLDLCEERMRHRQG